MKKILLLLVAIIFINNAFSQTAKIIQQASGKITLLRVHDVGTKYGPSTDQIDVEAIIQLDTQPGKAFGFRLRSDGSGPAREGMLSLLRDAFNNNWTVTIDYHIVLPKKNGVIFRVWLTK